MEINLEPLRLELESLIDPSLNITFKEANSLLKLEYKDDVVFIEVQLKNRKKDESDIKLNIARLVKIKYGFKGVHIEFFDSKYQLETEKKLKYLGVISGKGGVGKSSVSANLAVAFQRLGYHVGIIDADIYGSSLPSIFKMPIEPLDTTDEDEIIPAQFGEIQVLSPEFFMPLNQPLMWRGPMLGKLLTIFFENVCWDPDIEIIIVDLPPGTGDVQLDIKEFIPDAKMLLVTTPHPNASHVALKAGLGACEIGHEVIGVVENMSYYYNEAAQKKEYIFGEGGGKLVSEQLKAPLLMEIPINQPMDKNSYIYSLDDMNGKLYLQLAKLIYEKL
jgi:ATP-binding protein involved in chromosome partitioning